MSDSRIALSAGLAAAAGLDVYAYAVTGTMRALLTRHHWIFYLYLTVITALIVGAVTLAGIKATRALISSE